MRLGYYLICIMISVFSLIVFLSADAEGSLPSRERGLQFEFPPKTMISKSVALYIEKARYYLAFLLVLRLPKTREKTHYNVISSILARASSIVDRIDIQIYP